ncbi:uncharacterized protein H6S33_013053 [Morchella sextelata]|uniref:uncharacterized protein n=1 Tax=Morchella sextelata TaxID=1174677 RepID=UPI001D04DCE2|nr:uncharacterized protein H6S33_013053 [Morchella sextelata]KAH0609567.1 hypothetical protein H6S33_013053 [Morchella sextelata]
MSNISRTIHNRIFISITVLLLAVTPVFVFPGIDNSPQLSTTETLSRITSFLNPFSTTKYSGNMTGKKSVAYFVNWGIYGRNYQPQDVPAEYLTHILYSFANVRPESGEVYLSDTYSDLEKHYSTDSWNDVGTNVYGCIKQLFLLKKRNRKLKTLLSIGGWTYSSNFAVPASTATGREKFASSSIELLKDLGFDGIDIDWEFPKDITEAQNFVLLLAECRRQLDAYAARHCPGTRLLLTIAAPCGTANYSKLLMREMNQYLDFWNLMAYDFAGSWDSSAGHQANLYKSHQHPASTPFNANDAIEAYVSGGVPAHKIVMGLPLYGRAFENTNGPGHQFSGIGAGSWENGVWDYKDLARPGAHETEDKNIVASWCYDQNSRVMVSYDTPSIAEAKASYICSKGLAGGMWWELSGDKPITDPRSLIKTTVDTFGGCHALETTENLINYPASKYENLKNCFGNE